MKIRIFAVALATTMATPASAATLVYDYGTKPGSQALDLFNPALGTLLSVKGEFTGSEVISFNTNLTAPTLVNYTGKGFYSVYVGPLYFDFQAMGAGSVNVGSGPAQITLSGGTSQTRTTPFELALFTGVGTIGAFPTTDPAMITLSSGLVTDQSLVAKLTSFKITYTYDPVSSPVPEPASWAMMITGFGMAGAAIRRRRFRAAYA
jgi:hypothetical protein